MAQRGYANKKAKDRKKKRHPGGRGAPTWDPDQKPPMDMEKVEVRMKELVKKHKEDLIKFRGGTASVGMINTCPVKVYGQKVELQTVARIFKQGDAILNVQPFDPKSGEKIAEGIRGANLGLNPSPPENNIIKIVVPKPSKELRAEQVRSIKVSAEENRKYIRSLRLKALNEVKLSFEGSNEDMKAVADKEIHSMYVEHLDQMEELTTKKIKEVQA